MELRPHDLLRLTSTAGVQVADAPEWVAGALAAAPWVVVRRAPALAGRVAVGVRGNGREQRCAAFLDVAEIAEIVQPEGLAAKSAWEEAARPDHPVMAALAALAPALDQIGLIWGIAGGAGFELATGRPVLSPTSDLVLLVRANFPLPINSLQAIATAVATTIRVDVLVETPAGAIALAELMSDSSTLILRTSAGPKLVERASLAGSVPA